jgi:uncharacterized damage-inducible protein DinB
MSYAESLLPEFDQEMANTRKVLERVPDDKFDWQAHPKSHTIGWNAGHLANLPGWLTMTIRTDSLDLAPVGGQPYTSPKMSNRRDVLEQFDKNVAEARETLKAVRDDHMAKPWSLLSGGQTFFTMPRAAVVRGMVMNHIVHHRAILCVYLRLNNVPVPGMYGPSGDE